MSYQTPSEATFDEVARRIAGGETIADAVAAVGMSVATLYRRYDTADGIRLWATDRASGSRAVEQQVESLRNRIAHAVAEHGPFVDVEALRAQIAKPGERIEFSHLIGQVWSLQKRGEITFNQSSNAPGSDGRAHGPGNGSVRNIRALPRLYRRLGITRANGHDRTPEPPHDEAVIEASPPAEPERPAVTNLERAAEAAIEFIPAEYPILETIRARAGAAGKAREAVRLIEQAAGLLSADEKDRLLTEAAGLIERHDLTSIEEEYLAYAEAHR